MTSIKKNFGYNLILTFANYIFPLIIYPYITRVLGVNNIGTCSFVDSIINYFVLFSTLGIGSLGVREIARCKNNYDQRCIVFSNLLFFNLVMAIASIVILIVCTFTLDTFLPYKEFLLIGILKLLFTPLTIEWFFQGIQVFKFITKRTIIIRVFYIFSLFAFVHNESDVYIYYTLTALVIFFNAVWNYTYSRHYVKFVFKHINPLYYLSPILVFGYYRILTSLYTTFNTFYLGLTSGNAEVGYFTTATKINTVIMSVFTAFTTIMVPKVAEMLHDGMEEELRSIASKTFKLLITVALPIIYICLFCAEDIISIIAGPNFEGAIPIFRIVIGLILIIGLEQIVIQQFLMAFHNNKTIFIVSSVGAIIGLLVNFSITPSLGAIGSSISWALSEIGVLIAGLILLNKTMHITLQIKEIITDFLWSISYIIPLICIYLYVDNKWGSLFMSASVVCVVFFVINYYLRPQVLFVDFIEKLKCYFNMKK